MYISLSLSLSICILESIKSSMKLAERSVIEETRGKSIGKIFLLPFSWYLYIRRYKLFYFICTFTLQVVNFFS